MNKKGFTLIELLVVIVIIGIITSVILSVLNNARNKGADATIKANLNSILKQSEIVYLNSSPNSYNNVCNTTQNPIIAKAYLAAGNASGGTKACNSDANSWAVSVQLKVNNTKWWCVDSKSASREISANLGTGVKVCP